MYGWSREFSPQALPEPPMPSVAMRSPSPEPSTVILALQALIQAGKPFAAEIIVAGEFQKITIKDPNPCVSETKT